MIENKKRYPPKRLADVSSSVSSELSFSQHEFALPFLRPQPQPLQDKTLSTLYQVAGF